MIVEFVGLWGCLVAVVFSALIIARLLVDSDYLRRDWEIFGAVEDD